MAVGKTVEVTPTLDTSAYATGDHMGTVHTLTGVNNDGGQMTYLQGLVIVDRAKQKSALDVFFFDASPTVASSDNAAADVSDAEMVDKCIGWVTVAAADYKDLNANSTATVKDINLPLKPAASGTVYVLVVSRGSPTYGASDLTFKYTFEY